jgi:large subunit ribosomal protein L29
MKAAKWRDLSEDEIRQKAQELAEEIFNLRFQLSMGVAKNPSRVKEARRDLARAKTILAEKGLPELAAAPAAPKAEPARRRSRTGGRRRSPRGRAAAGARTAARTARKTATKTRRTTRKKG